MCTTKVWQNNPVDPKLDIGQEAYLRSAGDAFIVEILGIAKDTIWISFPDTAPPKLGAGVDLELHGDEGFVRYHTRVAVNSTGASTGLMLERRESAEYMKHRKNFRVSVTLPVWLIPAEGPEKTKGRMIDLSAEGTRIESEATLNVGEFLAIQVSLPGQPVVEIDARIVYLNKRRKKDFPCYGIQFMEISKRARRSLTEFLAQEIAAHYPKELRALYPRNVMKRRKSPR